MRLLLVAGLALLALVGCAREPLDIGYQGDPAAYETAQAAAAMWNEACRGRFVVVREGAGEIALTTTAGPPNPGQIATTHIENGTARSMRVDSTVSRRMMVLAIAHEYGHAMGLDHSDVGIMRAFPNEDTDLFITAENCQDAR